MSMLARIIEPGSRVKVLPYPGASVSDGFDATVTCVQINKTVCDYGLLYKVEYFDGKQLQEKWLYPYFLYAHPQDHLSIGFRTRHSNPPPPTRD